MYHNSDGAESARTLRGSSSDGQLSPSLIVLAVVCGAALSVFSAVAWTCYRLRKRKIVTDEDNKVHVLTPTPPLKPIHAHPKSKAANVAAPHPEPKSVNVVPLMTTSTPKAPASPENRPSSAPKPPNPPKPTCPASPAGNDRSGSQGLNPASPVSNHQPGSRETYPASPAGNDHPVSRGSLGVSKERVEELLRGLESLNQAVHNAQFRDFKVSGSPQNGGDLGPPCAPPPREPLRPQHREEEDVPQIGRGAQHPRQAWQSQEARQAWQAWQSQESQRARQAWQSQEAQNPHAVVVQCTQGSDILEELQNSRREPLEKRRSRFRKLCLQYHPDKTGSSNMETFQYLQQQKDWYLQA